MHLPLIPVTCGFALGGQTLPSPGGSEEQAGLVSWGISGHDHGAALPRRSISCSHGPKEPVSQFLFPEDVPGRT